MAQRVAASMAMIVFAICLAAGIAAENPFGTVITRALLAMLVTLVIGLIIGAMAQKMLEENVSAEGKKLKIDSVDANEGDR